jgi:hypothetical protein
LLLLAIGLAAASWRFVEQPFRRRRLAGQRRVFALAAGTMAITLMTAGWIVRTGGFPDRFSSAIRANDPERDREWAAWAPCDGRLPDRTATCRLGMPGDSSQFLLWGDSHARALATGVSQSAARHGTTGLLAYSATCAPLLGVEILWGSINKHCFVANRAVMRYIELHPELRTVILAARWAVMATGERYKAEAPLRVILSQGPEGPIVPNADGFDSGLRRTVTELLHLNRIVVLVGEVPEVGYSVPAAMAVASLTGRDAARIVAPTRQEFAERNALVTETLESLGRNSHVITLNPANKLCDERVCRVIDGGQALYRDTDHLASYGARYVAGLFDDLFLNDAEPDWVRMAFGR